MTTLIFVGRGRTDMTRRCLDSLLATNPRPETTFFVANADPETEQVLARYTWVSGLPQADNIGFWGGINLALQYVPLAEPFCYFGQDVVFAPDWLRWAADSYRSVFPEGLGLLTFKDDIQNGFNASHGMTTRRWLYVLFGDTFFPSDYKHYFCDSETTWRSKHLGRYAYVPESYVAHKHEPSGFLTEQDRVNIMAHDKTTETRRHEAWVNGEEERAVARLRQSQSAAAMPWERVG